MYITSATQTHTTYVLPDQMILVQACLTAKQFKFGFNRKNNCFCVLFDSLKLRLTLFDSLKLRLTNCSGHKKVKHLVGSYIRFIERSRASEALLLQKWLDNFRFRCMQAIPSKLTTECQARRLREWGRES